MSRGEVRNESKTIIVEVSANTVHIGNSTCDIAERTHADLRVQQHAAGLAPFRSACHFGLASSLSQLITGSCTLSIHSGALFLTTLAL